MIAEAGQSETEIPYKFRLNLRKTKYNWMKQIRPLTQMWKARSKIQAALLELAKNNGMVGGRKAGDHGALSMISIRGQQG